jgi:Dolichyl-phosphate-mannose-protein mannosyltransferase
MQRVFTTVPVLLAFVHIVLHLATGSRYGIFRDELYYWDCANHLAWGYVDHPPLSIALLAAWKGIFGSSLFSMRILPALAGGALILLVARLAARMGGGALAQGLAALLTFAVPSYLGITGFYSMNAYELVFWVVGCFVVLNILETNGRAAWVALGVCVGLGILNKISVGVFAASAALVILIATRARVLRTPGPYLAAAIALALITPHVAWQIANNWPTREFIENAQRYKMTAMSPPAFLSNVIMEMGPPLAPLHLVGLLALLFFPPLRRFRALAWIFLLALTIFMLNRSKPYYTVAAFPALIAACAVWVEAVARTGRRWIAPVVVVYAIASVALTAPFAIPLLSIERFLAYQDAIGIRPSSGENRDDAVLPQFFADRFGWQELAAQVAGIVNALSPAERGACLIVADNYGQAGAINYFGASYGLHAVSQHNSYYLWGYGTVEPRVYVIIGQEPDDLAETFDEVHEVARTSARYAMPDEVGVPISLCRGIKMPLDEAWQRGRMFI